MHTFEIGRCSMLDLEGHAHPEDAMVSVFGHLIDEVEIYLKEQGAQPIFTTKVVEDPDCEIPMIIMSMTLFDDTKAVYFKMWFNERYKESEI